MNGNDAIRARARPTVFFIAAAGHAALAVPLWVITYAGLRETGLPAAWHGGEMIFGYAYAVFGGFFLTRVPKLFLLSLLAIWLAARILALMPEPSFAATVTSVVYPCLLFGYAVWPFIRAVKRWRNAVFVPVLATLFAASVLHGMAAREMVPAGQGIRLAFDLILIMLFTMGGRFTAGAVSGAVQAQGGRLRKPAQPSLERVGLACLFAVAAIDLFVPFGYAVATVSALAMAVVFARLYCWRGWRVISHPEVAFLLLGYLWLGLGLGARALAFVTEVMGPVEADHILAVGGLGTLSMTVMARVARQRCGYHVKFKPILVAALSLVSVSALLRFLAALDIDRDAMLLGAGGCWSAAFVIFTVDLVILWRGARRPLGRGLQA